MLIAEWSGRREGWRGERKTVMEKRVIGGQRRRLSREECERKEGREGEKREKEGRKKGELCLSQRRAEPEGEG